VFLCVGEEGDKLTFYVTNFPDHIPLFRVRQAFEVCGILTDVYIARHGNARGQEFDFVRYVNVKSKEKLAHALYNVWIDQNCVWAREAKFYRFAHNDIAPRVSNSVVKNNEIKVQPLLVSRDEGVKNVRRGNLVLGENGEGVFVRQGKQTEVREQGVGGVTVKVGEIAVCVGGDRGKKKGRPGEGESATAGGSVVGGKAGGGCGFPVRVQG